ncbi:Stk1 family PASTA domain-containing Ser/Thr kinase [Jatrophihabitans sp.]|uniref:Stk1 family PASTA domain-containing Ser/Thr kinase n=1 Tax=Jatrophihabitans sp. TaxID=1932789 RepID=UPI0030C6BFA7|nr:serine/threonine protein kinase [Jatrophihabitans sp.]
MTQPRLVGGRYELGELIGYGGMAEVHRGRDIRLGRDVAIKVLRPDLARDPSFLNRFRREAQSAAGLNHPSIVSVYDTGEDITPEGATQPFIVMEYVEGRTLRDILKAEGRLPARRAMEITADVCGALEFSHRNGLIHRDIKPANVMITNAGAVKVMDFGIARTLADDASTVTQTANVIGTAQYLSPEQARGETVDARSDVYSTGCLLYELVTGVPPFQGDSPVAVAYQHVRENAPTPSSRVPDLPRVLDSIVMKALAKNMLNRYQSAGEMRGDLQRAMADQPVVAESVMTDAERTSFIARTPAPGPVALQHGGPEPEYEEPERRTGLIWAAIVVALLLVIGGGILAIHYIGNNSDSTKKFTLPSGLIGKTVDADRTALQASDPTGKFLANAAGSTTNGPCDDGSTPTTQNVVCKLTDINGAKLTPGTSSITAGSTVFYQLFVIAKVNVPYVVGETVGSASDQLTQAKLVPKVSQVDNKATKGTVLSQSPDTNTSVPPGTKVTLTVSSGQIKLPDVRSKKATDAKEELNGLGFTNVDDTSNTEVTHDKSKDGYVADMNLTPNIAYAPNVPITLTVYKYEMPQPTCTTPPPTPTPPPGSTPTPPGSTPTPTTAASTTASGGLPACTS